ncbi:MAG TPA: hypothetical protein VFV34_04010 [Blastocatellia bacterium]|nr:hypothetical protein [Blastocatellia bacterium]
METLQLRGGVIIIGSLLWDDDLKRSNWRESCLRTKDKILAELPIRYGRWSDKRRTYTMVFSANCKRASQIGAGFVIPIKAHPIKDIQVLICQARMMAEAEGMGESFVGRTKKGVNWVNWALMGILLNPKLTRETRTTALAGWATVFKADGGPQEASSYKIGQERSSISKVGELLIRWPRAADPRKQRKIDEIDFLIATCTKPGRESSEAYPSLTEIAESARCDCTRYFLNNRKFGIKTFQDTRVVERLSS